MEYVLLLTSLLAFGWCTFAWIEAELFQTYENWRLENALRKAQASTAAGLGHSPSASLKEEVPKSLGGQKPNSPERESVKQATRSRTNLSMESSLVGRLEIPRLGLSAIVTEGIDDRNLRRALGHIPGTALPGEDGNVGIAGHRDTFFRKLQAIRRDDTITLTTVHGSYRYIVKSILVVDPDYTSVLRSSAGRDLTLVTCFPFRYVGSAPRRFVVQAEESDG